LRRAAAVALLVCLCWGCDPKNGNSGSVPQNSAGPHLPLTKTPDGKPIVRAIKDHLGADFPLSNEAQFTTGFSDLNGDGNDEAIVYLLDGSTCGSGGCNTYVLAQQGADAWRVVGDITITRPPIYRLPPGKDGWAELGVTVSGGGLARRVMAVPHGDKGYAHNPTVPPARPIDPGEAEVLISQEA
jgi:putative lipoprotein